MFTDTVIMSKANLVADNILQTGSLRRVYLFIVTIFYMDVNLKNCLTTLTNFRSRKNHLSSDDIQIEL